MAAPTTALTRATTYDNKGALADAFLTEIARTYEGTALGRQELMGELVETRSGALWSWDMIEAARRGSVPALDRIVVAVDPPVTSGEGADACALVVAGTAREDGERVAWVLANATVQGLSPGAWGARAAALFADWSADRVVAEVNQGGELVVQVLRSAAPHLPIRAVRATRGKTLRAEPIAALYERGLVRHAGSFPELEQQMTAFTGAPGEDSPDRLDALVWALTDLMLGPQDARPSVRTL